jgi:oligopeptidase B
MKKLIYSILVVAATALMTAQRTPSNPAGTVTPPVAKKIHTENHIHGGTLVDDYRWLREKSNADPSSNLSSNLSA